MNNLSFGQILLLILFIIVPLVNFLLKRVRSGLETQTPNDEALTQMRRQAQTPPSSLPSPRPSRDQLRESTEPTVTAPLPKRRFSRLALLKNKRDVRRGIIIMTILGPCRTFDSLD